MKDTKEISYISFLQFVGPIFVVLGHSLNGVASDGIWWQFTKRWIYIFHMPLFFMISGYLLSYKGWLRERTYSAFIKEKFVRLLIPYLVWNIIFIVPKFFLQSVISDNVRLDFLDMIKMLISPRESIWGHTWFLVALFIVYLLTPIWEKIVNSKCYMIWVLTAFIGIIIYMMPVTTTILCLNDLHKDILFFLMGCFMGNMELDKMSYCLKKNFIFIVLGSIISSIICLTIYNGAPFLFIPCTFILLELFSLPLVFSIDTVFIKVLAKRSFGIYIMHWPVMICVRILLLQIMHLPIVVVVICMILCGYFIPNLIISILQRICLGRLEKTLKILLGI